MNKALVLLTLALVIGIAAAPTVTAACPPNGRVYCGPATPVGAFVGCVIDAAGDFAAEAAADCL